MKPTFERDAVTFGGSSASRSRHNLRLGPPRQLRCSLKDLSGHFVPRDISAGGFSILSVLPLRVDDIHEATLTFETVRVVRSAKVIHCRPEGEGYWITGLKFLSVERGGATVEELLDRIAPEMKSQ